MWVLSPDGSNAFQKMLQIEEGKRDKFSLDFLFLLRVLIVMMATKFLYETEFWVIVLLEMWSSLIEHPPFVFQKHREFTK